MPGNLPRDSKYDAGEGVPWQIIYAAFLGIMLCCFAFYGGLALVNGGLGRGAVAAGTATIFVSLALATCHGALLTGVWWSIVVCRISMPLFAAASLAALVWGVIDAAGDISWYFSLAALWDDLVTLVFSPQVLLPLAAVAACGAMTWFLFGRVSKRFFDR